MRATPTCSPLQPPHDRQGRAKVPLAGRPEPVYAGLSFPCFSDAFFARLERNFPLFDLSADDAFFSALGDVDFIADFFDFTLCPFPAPSGAGREVPTGCA